MKHRSPLFTLAVAVAFAIMFIVNMVAGPPGNSSGEPATTTAAAGTAALRDCDDWLDRPGGRFAGGNPDRRRSDQGDFMSSIPVPAPEAPAAPSSSNLVPVLVAFAIGTAVSIALGVYGRLHTPTGHAVIAGFATERQRRQR